jgi:serine/threonine protein phosphatase 1
VVVIHGHTPFGIEVRPNRINIDTGAYFSGVLTAVEIAGDRMRFVHAIGEPDTDLYRP